MKKAAIILSFVAFAFAANAQASASVQTATPVMKVDAGTPATETATTTDGSTEGNEKKACCKEGSKQGKACCDKKSKASGCSKSGQASGTAEAKACCKNGSTTQACAHHGGSSEHKGCSHGATEQKKEEK
ncbi:MAG: hypothetical protein KIS94_07345 [Chitinophagales bacterium]|nr:hypothetical protein [Chitinophagales bacterium]